MMNVDLAQKLLAAQRWHHDFEVLPGLRTNGAYNPEGLWNELHLPADMTGLRLADVGASNGYFSFSAHRPGAAVTAFDYRHRDNSGFTLLSLIQGVDIPHHQVNVLELSPEVYGQFDIVLALGLLYHTPDPYRALVNCASLASQRLLVESYCIDHRLPEALRVEPVMRFLPDPERFPNQGQPNDDPSNFWGFTSVCLKQMLEDVGFAVDRIRVEADRVLADAHRVGGNDHRLQLAYQCFDHQPPTGDPLDPAAWTIF
ncbi:DUF1698 domain-containing protein [Chloracidobacterium validum]|uniref:DUF1698 domain-containing protein n=1 Tax=Chloracidobacterium validum TaxID=2821543 RepID=A0ABX8BCR4_9BACT|nr:DUF1698 domain-containing protein [Chloracidobacterium validum]QUW04608.1 DUF1698 domain-containing protein [Chloracidobacterium validum]